PAVVSGYQGTTRSKDCQLRLGAVQPFGFARNLPLGGTIARRHGDGAGIARSCRARSLTRHIAAARARREFQPFRLDTKWGEALRTLAAEITLAEKNGDRHRGQTLQLYRAWVHRHAMDFPGVQEICGSILPSLDEPARRRWP